MKNILFDPNITIHLAKYKTVSSDWTKQSFSYPHNRIYYVTEGEAEVELTDRHIQLKKGYMYLLPAFMMIKTICKDMMGHYFVHFQADSILNMNTHQSEMPIMEVNTNNCQDSRMFFQIIMDHYRSNKISSILRTKGAIQLLLASFFEETTTFNSQIDRFSRVIHYVDQNISQDIYLETLANLVNLDVVYFSNLFSKTFGIPPRQYINKKRLQFSQSLLLSSNKKVKEIAQEVGFSNEMYFSRLFHAKVGMTPLQYRKIARDT